MMNDNMVKIGIAVGVLVVVVIIIFLVMRKRDNYQYPEGQLYPGGKYIASTSALPWFRKTGNGGQPISQPYSSGLVTDEAGNINVTAVVPIGGIIMWSGSIASIPAGWGLCNGAVYGSIVSPDLTSRFVVGAGKSNTQKPYDTQYTVGDMGGEEFHQLTVEEMPSHSHSIDIGASTSDPPWNGIEFRQHSNGPMKSSSTGGDPNNNNATLPHNNMPPYYALAYIIKYM